MCWEDNVSSECTEILYMRDAGILIRSFPHFLKSGRGVHPRQTPVLTLATLGRTQGYQGLTLVLISKVRTEGKTDTREPSDN